MPTPRLTAGSPRAAPLSSLRGQCWQRLRWCGAWHGAAPLRTGPPTIASEFPGEYPTFARNIGCKNEPDLLATPLLKKASAARVQTPKLPGKGENQVELVFVSCGICSHLSLKVWGRNCLAINYYLAKKQIMGLTAGLNKLLWGPGYKGFQVMPTYFFATLEVTFSKEGLCNPCVLTRWMTLSNPLPHWQPGMRGPGSDPVCALETRAGILGKRGKI